MFREKYAMPVFGCQLSSNRQNGWAVFPSKKTGLHDKKEGVDELSESSIVTLG